MTKSAVVDAGWLTKRRLALVGESQTFSARTMKEHALELFRRAPVATTMLAAALVLGYLQGWMKLRFGSWTTFAFDIPLVISLIFSITENRDRMKVTPDTPVGAVLWAYVGLCWVYAVISIVLFGIPPLAVIAGTRAWTLFVLCYLQGYHLFRSVKQAELLWGFITLITLGVTYYGLRQTQEEIMAMMRNNPELMRRLNNQFMAGKAGGTLRVFSTFVTSAAYAGALVLAVQMLAARMANRLAGLGQRLILLGLILVFVYAIFRSGSRSSLVFLMVGLAVMFSTIRTFFLFGIPGAGVLGAGLWYADQYTGGIVAERFATLLDADTISMRAWIGLAPMFQYVADHPLGGGIGRSGAGVPMIFMSVFKNYEGISADSGLGCLGIDMGITGLAMCLIFLGVAAWRSWTILRQTRNEDSGVVTLPATLGPIVAFLTCVIGNPFIGIPHAAMTWMLLGASDRLFVTRQQLLAAGGVKALEADERMIGFNRSWKQRKEEEKAIAEAAAAEAADRGLGLNGRIPARGSLVSPSMPSKPSAPRMPPRPGLVQASIGGASQPRQGQGRKKSRFLYQSMPK